MPDVPQEYRVMDDNHVDLFSGSPSFDLSDVSIGHDMGLVHTFYSQPFGFPYVERFEDNFSGKIALRTYPEGLAYCTGSATQETNGLIVTIGRSSEEFCPSAGAYFSRENKGGTLVALGGGRYTYSDRTGTDYTFDELYGDSGGQYGYGALARVVRAHQSNGIDRTYFYQASAQNVHRLVSITQNNGLQLRYSYNFATYAGSYSDLSGVTALNLAIEYCDASSFTCSPASAWPSAYYVYPLGQNTGYNSLFTVTDQGGQVTRFTMDIYGRIIAVKPPSSANDDTILYNYCPPNQPEYCYIEGPDPLTTSYILSRDRVVSVARNGLTWQYSLEYPNLNPNVVRRDFNYQRVSSSGLVMRVEGSVNINDGTSFLAALSLENGQAANYDTVSTSNRLTGDSYAESNGRIFVYDSRGNTTQITFTAKPGSSLPNRTIRAGYDSACANRVTCNKPNWVEDANGNRTDLTYDPVHGGVLTETGPAVNGIRPQTRYSYAQRYAWFLDASGAYVRAAMSIWVLDHESFCRTSAAVGSGCAVAGDEVITNYDYGPDNGPNNLFLRGRVVTADGQSLRTCFAYDRFGNRISETTPGAGLTSCS